MTHFTPALFDFLDELAMNNHREWFGANKERYRTEVQDPLVRFVADFEPRLRSISPHMVADPRRSGGSVFRIYRDVRFSRDKSPLQDQRRHPLPPRGGTGGPRPWPVPAIWSPATSSQARLWKPKAATAWEIRQAIVERTRGMGSHRGREDFASMFDLEGESLKRAPRGFDPDHPHIEYLKLKSFVAVTSFTEGRPALPTSSTSTPTHVAWRRRSPGSSQPRSGSTGRYLLGKTPDRLPGEPLCRPRFTATSIDGPPGSRRLPELARGLIAGPGQDSTL